MKKQGYPKGLLFAIIGFIVLGLGASLLYLKSHPIAQDAPATPVASPVASMAPAASTAPGASIAPTAAIDLSTDDKGLSKSVVTIQTPKGTIRFKFYSKDAPNTTKRIVELIQQKFYDGLSFHRVVPGFVIQGGDPNGNGTGGSGQRLKAEFNSRKHVEGTVAMARASDPDSADSQFYIALATIPHLDNNYTVFGQVVEGLDVVKQIQIGDKMTSVTIQ